MGNFYINKNSFCAKQIEEEIDGDVGIIVVIPCFKEEQLVRSLNALYTCEKPNCKVEVITVINASEIAGEDDLKVNKQTLKDALGWQKQIDESLLKFHFIEQNSLPKKHAGVGLARKIGMDEAVRRFHSINKDGIIVCFDADAQCSINYLTEIEKHFAENPKSHGCSIHFEHPLDGDEFSQEVYAGIIDYELFLRYYRQGLKFAGLPYAYHTIGSSMMVKSSVYQKQGGMNRKKAGEDFYFLQKIIELGGFTEIENAQTIPSPRPSDRVPFGTGRAINRYLEKKEVYTTYDYRTFIDLKLFNSQLHLLYGSKVKVFLEVIPASMKAFLENEDLFAIIDEIHRNATTEAIFYKRLYKWFNAFKVLKYVHYTRDNFYSEIPVNKAAIGLLKLNEKEFANNKELLEIYRSIDKKLN